MNAKRVLAHYERIADAPDAIARLRRFMLDLAVRGKLVPQDPKDEPASELLKRIAKEKLDQGDLPQGWRRARIGSILEFQYGKGLKATERLDEGPVPVFGSNGIVGFTDEPLTVRPSIIVGRKGSAGALNLCDGPSWTTDVAYFVEAPSFLDLRYLLNAFAALDLDTLGKGVKPGLSRSEAYDQIVALPPLAEQHRIVAKVDELMALCDQLEEARTKREAVRDRLSASSLSRLNIPDPESFKDDARFALENLSSLTARADQIKLLRQTILNLAVRGKLVPQNPRDEPASELLKRIEKEKARLAQAREISPVKSRGRTKRDELVFDIAEHWQPVRMSDVLDELQTGPFGSSLHQSDYVSGGTPVINPASLQNGRIVPIEKMAISPATLDRLASFKLRAGDIVMARRGEMGRCALVGDAEVGWLCGTGSLILRPSRLIHGPFLVLLIGSPKSRNYLGGTAVGATMQNLNQSILLNLPFGLAPFAEQHRIVAKVDELMRLCDQLEAGLAGSTSLRGRLLNALLAEALEPEVETEAEAA